MARPRSRDKNTKEKGGRFSRLSKKLKKAATMPIPMSDLPEDAAPPECPPKFESFLTMKPYKNMRINISKRYAAKLSRGFLKLTLEKGVLNEDGLASEFTIDLAKIRLMSDDDHRRLIIAYRTEAHQIAPIRPQDYDTLREIIHRHRLYRQSVVRSRADDSSDPAYPLPDRRLSSTSVVLSKNQGLPSSGVDSAIANGTRREAIPELQGVIEKIVGEIRVMGAEIKEMRQDFNSQMRVMMASVKKIAAKTPKEDTSEEEDESSEEGSERSPVIAAKGAKKENGSCEKPDIPKRIQADQKNTAASPGVAAQEKVTSQTVKTAESNDSNREVKMASSVEPRNIRKRREVLPKVAPQGEELGITRIMAIAARRSSLPISFFEPLSVLQVLCEELRYADSTLSKAVSCTDPLERLALVTAFAVSGYAGIKGRKRKPFNPILGETYDYISNDGWKYHAEQVSHRPPVTAAHADGPGWTWWQTFIVNPKSSWSGTVETTPELNVRVRLGQEDYTWNKVKIMVENASCTPEYRILKLDGTLYLRCNNGFTSTVIFDKEKKTEVSASICDKSGVPVFKLTGYWDKYLRRTDGEKTALFEAIPAAKNSSKFYGLSQFASGLNEILEGEKQTLPPTDSRFREDMRALETGDIAKAASVKLQLEKAQRERSEATHKRLWFEQKLDGMTYAKMWVSNGKYWDAKEKRFQGVDILPLFR